MILNFLPLILIFIGFGGGLIYLIFKTVSFKQEELADYSNVFIVKIFNSSKQAIKNFFENATFDDKLILWLEKMLLRLKILALKVENWLSKQVENLKERRINSKIDNDIEYWQTLPQKNLAKNFDKLFKSKLFQNVFDPVDEELKLKKTKKADFNSWLTLINYYLSRNNFSEAQRIIIYLWERGNLENQNLVLEEILDNRVQKEN
ncbi:MAG TPA: hypothetical protein PLA57_00670 [Candidatus Paceibacterota bacterium]|nr:hypothetical protein [Candidatus Paceibacterota bacterium]HRS47711.1 hypothetical protein [Candidatus Paceibacterota bacterium]